MKIFFGPLPINLVNNEPLIINENWPRFNVISNGIFDVNSPLAPCISFNVNEKPTSVLKLFCHQPILKWEHVNILASRPLTSVTEGPD